MPEMYQKKVLVWLIPVMFFMSASFVFAACDPNWPMFCNPISSGTAKDVIIVIIKFLLSIIGVISLLFIVFAGIKYVTSAGSEDSIKSAKNTLTAAVTGLVLALMAYGIIVELEKILMVK